MVFSLETAFLDRATAFGQDLIMTVVYMKYLQLVLELIRDYNYKELTSGKRLKCAKI